MPCAKVLHEISSEGVEVEEVIDTTAIIEMLAMWEMLSSLIEEKELKQFLLVVFKAF